MYRVDNRHTAIEKHVNKTRKLPACLISMADVLVGTGDRQKLIRPLDRRTTYLPGSSALRVTQVQ